MEVGSKKKVIRSFQDLDVYQRLYQAMLVVIKEVLPKLPKEERFDLVDQMRRCSKASPALLAEGFAKRNQVRQWRKYLDDAIGECNEMINHLSVCRDAYGEEVGKDLCERLIEQYDIANRQLYHLRQAWKAYHAND